MSAACPSCGAALEPHDRFCGGCGEPVAARPSDPDSPAEDAPRLPPVPPPPPMMGVEVDSDPAWLPPVDQAPPFDTVATPTVAVPMAVVPTRSRAATVALGVAVVAAVAALIAAVVAVRQRSDGDDRPSSADAVESTAPDSDATTLDATSVADVEPAVPTSAVTTTAAPSTTTTTTTTVVATTQADTIPPEPRLPVGVEDSGRGLICSVMADGRRPTDLGVSEQTALAAIANLTDALGARDYVTASRLLGGTSSTSDLATGYANFDGTSLLFTRFTTTAAGTEVDFLSFALENGLAQTHIYRIRWRVLADGTVRYLSAGPNYEAVPGAWSNVELISSNPAIIVDNCG